MNRRGFLRLVGLAPVAGLAGAGLVKRRDPNVIYVHSIRKTSDGGCEIVASKGGRRVVGVDPGPRAPRKVGVYSFHGVKGALYRLDAEAAI